MSKKITALLLSAVITISLFPAGVGVYAEDNSAPAESGTIREIREQINDPSNDPFDYVSEKSKRKAAGDKLPERVDLRNYEGKNYITPVKSQYPFGTCWGFAAIAAAESSILSNEELNKDEETGEQLYSTSLHQGDDGLPILDLSEKHLAYFVVTPLDDAGNPQDGEGTYLVEGSNVSDGLDNGGLAILASNMFASGIGPILESMDECLQYKGGIRLDDGTIDYEHANVEIEMVNGKWKKLTYSDEDDWSLDESWRMKQSYVLKESYMLPSPSGRDENDKYVYNKAGTNAIKEQLNQKRAVEVAFGYAEKAIDDEGDSVPLFNYDNWAFYNNGITGGNHAVTIVGYDDNYPKENFSIQPPENGAWLVKNSWGSGEESFPNANREDWGLFHGQDTAPYEKTSDIHTGYFWMSYYEHSLENPEALVFDKSNVGKSYILDEHDYMPAYRMAGAATDGKVDMANVFKAEYGEKLEQISFFTSAPDSTVTYSVYLLQDDFADPTDGVLVTSGTETYKYGGFHKVDLDNQPLIARGQHYSIVVNEMADGKYVINMPVGMTEQLAADYDATTYQKGIVNEKESYVFVDNGWKDYSDIAFQEQLLGEPSGEATFDNFPIKGYCTETGNDLRMRISLEDETANPFQGFCTYPGIDNSAVYMVKLKGSSIIPEDAEVTWSVTNDELFTLEPNKDRVKVSVTDKEGKCYLECSVDGIGSARIPIESAELELLQAYSINDEYVYTGKPIEPHVYASIVHTADELTMGKEFTVRFTNNVKCGKAKLTAYPNEDKITGNPTGYFIIIPAKAAVSKLAPGKKSLKVTAKNQKASGLTGYQISYRVKGTKKWKTVLSNGNVKVIKKLRKGKKYQVRIRGFVKVDGKKHYGEWSAVKTSKKIR